MQLAEYNPIRYRWIGLSGLLIVLEFSIQNDTSPGQNWNIYRFYFVLDDIFSEQASYSITNTKNNSVDPSFKPNSDE